MKFKTGSLMLIIFSLGLSMISSHASAAVVLKLSPSSQLASLGDNISLNLEVSGLIDGGAPSLGDFDIDLLFDTNKLTFSSYTLGSKLGDISLFEAEDFSGGGSGGGINLAEVSFLSPADLITSQPDSFILATIFFNVSNLQVGESTTVSIANIAAIGDENGVALQVNEPQNAVIRNGTQVPEPSSLLLVVLALSGFSYIRFRNA